jgi:hypothetical protein
MIMAQSKEHLVVVNAVAVERGEGTAVGWMVILLVLVYARSLRCG